MNDKIVFLEPITLGVSEQLRLGKKAITKERCEKVEVGEIEYEEEVDSCHGLQINIEGLSKLCGKSSECIKQEIERIKERRNEGKNYYCLAECSNIDKSCKWFKVYTLPKKDLTKEWILENCKCININQPCENLECKKGGKCIGYKCFEDYFIEIK